MFNGKNSQASREDDPRKSGTYCGWKKIHRAWCHRLDAAYQISRSGSLLVKLGHEVFVVMTQDATELFRTDVADAFKIGDDSFYDEKEAGDPVT